MSNNLSAIYFVYTGKKSFTCIFILLIESMNTVRVSMERLDISHLGRKVGTVLGFAFLARLFGS